MEYFTVSLSAVLISALVGVLVRSIWYSSYLFQNVWRMGEGVDEKSLPIRTRKYKTGVALYSFIAHSGVALVLGIMFELLQIKDMRIAVCFTLLLTFGFVVTTRYIDMLYTLRGEHWNKRAQISFLTSSGYYIVTTALMAAALIFFSQYF